MNKEEMLSQLESIREHCKSMIPKDEPDSVWRFDVEALDMAISTIRQQWISVKDSLPDRTMPPHDVLVYHDLNCGMFIDRAWYSHEKNKWRSAVGMNLKVTHWMPLPDMPEDGTV